MKCFNHPDTDAVGLCSKCNKAGCRHCLKDIGGAIACSDCLAEHVRQSDAEIASEIDVARRRMKRSWIVTIVLSLLFVPIIVSSVASDPTMPAGAKPLLVPIFALLTIYMMWAGYWGIPATWTWWRGLFERMGCVIFANPFMWLVLLISFFVVPLYFGWIYGVFGGAFYQFNQCRRLLKAHSVDA